MFSHIPLELEGTEAEAMDLLYNEFKSVRKRGDVLNKDMSPYLPDQVTYLVMIILSDYLEKDTPDYSAVDRLLRCINFETVESHVVIALLRMLRSSEHMLKEHKSFYKSAVARLTVLNLDVDKVIQDL